MKAKGLSMNTTGDMTREVIDGKMSIFHFTQHYDDGGLMERELTCPISMTSPWPLLPPLEALFPP